MHFIKSKVHCCNEQRLNIIIFTNSVKMNCVYEINIDKCIC